MLFRTFVAPLELSRLFRDQRLHFLGRESQMDGLGEKNVGRRAEPLAPRLRDRSLPTGATNTPSPGRVWTIPSRSRSV